MNLADFITRYAAPAAQAPKKAAAQAPTKVQAPKKAAAQAPVFVQVHGHDACPTPQEEPGKRGDAKRGRALLTQVLEAAPRGAPGRGYSPSGDYDALWKKGGEKSLTDMRGYDPIQKIEGVKVERGAHTGIVATLGAWQPNLRHFDLILLNSSGGKDSAAMLVVMKTLAEAQGVLDRVEVVHADLGSAEHTGVGALAADQARRLGLPFHVVHREVRGVRLDLLDRFVDNLQDKFLAYPSTQREKNALERLEFETREDTETDPVWVRYAETKERKKIRTAILGMGFEEMPYIVSAIPNANERTFEKKGFEPAARGEAWEVRVEPDAREEMRAWLLSLGLTEREEKKKMRPGDFRIRESGAKGNPDPGRFHLRRAGGFPGFGTRYCTSEFKTAEVSKWTTAFVKQHLKALGRPARVLNVLGLRAYESENRAGKGFDVKGDDTQARQTREWLPIQTLPESAVWDLIKAGGLPYHPVYDLGFQRLSCRLCPLAGDKDVALAALTYPQLTTQITAMEDTYDFKFKEKYGLREIIQRALQKDADIPALAQAARQALRKRYG